MAVGERQVVEEMETSGGRCIYGLSVLFCDCHSVMSSRRQTQVCCSLSYSINDTFFFQALLLPALR